MILDEDRKGVSATMVLITEKDITVPVTVQTRTALPPHRAFQPAVDLSLVFKGCQQQTCARRVATGEYTPWAAKRAAISFFAATSLT